MVALFLFCWILAGCGSLVNRDGQEEGLDNQTLEPKTVIETEIFVSRLKFNSLVRPKVKSIPLPEGQDAWKALVVPHHALVGNLAGEALAQLRDASPAVVVIMGPNHQNSGYPASTTKAVWQTAGGPLEGADEAIDALLASGLVAEDDSLFAGEHSIGALLPYLAYYLPEAKIVPLALHYKYPLEKADQLLDILAPWLENGVLVASIDFSHGLNGLEAEIRDQETRGYLESYDYPGISLLDSYNLDAPTIMAMVMKYALAQGRGSFTVLANTNSGRIMEDSTMEVTSYFTLLY